MLTAGRRNRAKLWSLLNVGLFLLTIYMWLVLTAENNFKHSSIVERRKCNCDYHISNVGQQGDHPNRNKTGSGNNTAHQSQMILAQSRNGNEKRQDHVEDGNTKLKEDMKYLRLKDTQHKQLHKENSMQKPISLDDLQLNAARSFKFMYGKTVVKVVGSVPYDRDVALFIGIHSGPDMVHRRQVLRQSYLSTISNSNRYIVHRFILGWPTNDLLMENSKFDDMLFVNQSERYKPYDSILPYKHASILNVAKRLNSKWLLKTDDDAMINLPAILDKLKSFTQDHFYGQCHFRDYPIRDRSNIWYISEFFWPGKAPYPPYCIGAGYLLPKKGYVCATNIIAHPSYRFFPLEDVETGGLMRKCNITAIDVKGIYGEPESSRPYFLIQHHLRSAQSLRMYWDRALKMNKNLGIS